MSAGNRIFGKISTIFSGFFGKKVKKSEKTVAVSAELSDNNRVMRDLTEAEKNCYLKEKLEEIFEKYQKPNSIQNTHTPKDLIDNIINNVGLDRFEGKDVLVIANYDILKYLVVMKLHKKLINYKSITFLTDIDPKTLPAKDKTMYETVVANLSEPDTIDMMGKKFDIVIGNPPYSEGLNRGNGNWAEHNRTTPLYEKFVYYASSITVDDGLIAMVLPSKWTNNDKCSFTKWVVDINSGLKVATNATKYFPNVKIPVCWILLDKKYHSANKIINNVETTIDNYLPVKMQSAELSIFNKITSNTSSVCGDIWALQGMIKRNNPSLGTGDINVIEVTGKLGESLTLNKIPLDKPTIEKKFKHFDSWKVITNSVGGAKNIGALKVGEPGYITTSSVVSLKVADKSQAERLIDYLNSSLVKWLVLNIKVMATNSKSMFNKIPLLDLTRTWTDEELYAHFDLTQEEIDLIEKSV